TLETTTDEVPLVSGLGLRFEDPSAYKQPGRLPDYLVRVLATNDEEAARSADLDHPGWTLAMPGRLVRASAASPALWQRAMFPRPVRARWLRLVARVADGDWKPEERRFVLHGLTVLRPRDFSIAPEPEEDVLVDFV